MGDRLTGACSNCHATAPMRSVTGDRAVSHIYHDEGCPAVVGAVRWRAVE